MTETLLFNALRQAVDEEMERDDTVLVLLGTFNNVILSNCNKNGCLNSSCKLNKVFINDYNDISRSLVFNSNINNITDRILSDLNFKPYDYCTFHLRTSDSCENKLFENDYNNYQESIVYQSIVNYLFENNKKKFVDKIFVCLPPQALKIKDLQIFNSDKVHILDQTKQKEEKYEHNEKFLRSRIDDLIAENMKSQKIGRAHV